MRIRIRIPNTGLNQLIITYLPVVSIVKIKLKINIDPHYTVRVRLGENIHHFKIKTNTVQLLNFLIVSPDLDVDSLSPL